MVCIREPASLDAANAGNLPTNVGEQLELGSRWQVQGVSIGSEKPKDPVKPPVN